MAEGEWADVRKQAEAGVYGGSSVTWPRSEERGARSGERVEGRAKPQPTGFLRQVGDDTRSKPLLSRLLVFVNVIPTHQKVSIQTVPCPSPRSPTPISYHLSTSLSFPPCRKLGAEFLCRVRYRNNLPPLPFAPKLIATPPLTARFVKYESTSLIEKTPYALAVDQDLGMPIDVATVQYLERLELGGGQDDQAVQAISPEDRELFVEPPEDPLHAGTGLKRSKAPRPIVTWLRRSEYISSEASKAAIAKDQSVESR
ncbi:Paf1-domain-containing protein [Endogone sp. FLAS-F59071]|nr:Paf1-domain-containing protein [Endogone sp. FLAS-F59071]|eukprot:RUS23099.1 Paf1-domain-containing protein [Endogone sp. FLAS-F59071]